MQYLPRMVTSWYQRRVVRYLQHERFKREIRRTHGEGAYESLLERECLERRSLIAGWAILAVVAGLVVLIWNGHIPTVWIVEALQYVHGLFVEAAFLFIGLA